MKRGLIIAVLIFAGLGAAYIAVSPGRPFIASLFFPSDLTEKEILDKHNNGGRLRILVVPGHDNEFPGAEYRDLREADLTLKIGKYLFDYLKTNPRLDPGLARDDKGYAPTLARYFEDGKDNIKTFIKNARQFFNNLVSSDKIEKSEPPFYRSKANSKTILRLYGINKWANDNKVDIILHLHLNNYEDRGKNNIYSGFSIYVPEGQMPNYEASKPIAEALKNVFIRHWPASNLHLEKDTVIEDPDLIALGSYGSLRSASVLVEYGYIYEPRFRLEAGLKQAAFLTYYGLLSYLGRGDQPALYEYGWLFPYEWRGSAAFSDKNSEAVAVLQIALQKLGFYPPKGGNLYGCPVSGDFQTCTLKALSAFQSYYNIYGELGTVGPKTQEKLRELGIIR